MKKIAAVLHTSLKAGAGRILALTLLLLVTTLNVKAQSGSSVTDGSTPLGLSPGAPAGSYSLSGFESINPYNGNLNFSLPLLQIGGRGGVQHTIPLKLEQHWKTFKAGQSPGPFIYYPTPNSWEGIPAGYSPGVMNARLVGINDFESCGSPLPSVTRLTFTTGDGTEYEFRDARFDGRPFFNQYAGAPDGSCHIEFTTNRGRVFYTFDGSAMTFISDEDIWDFYKGGNPPDYAGIGITQWPNLSGYMFMPDGTRYRIDNSEVSWIQDRNGNRMTFSYGAYGVSQITDSLGRIVRIRYEQEFQAPNPHADYDEITYSGFGGASRSIKVFYDKMRDHLRTTQSGDQTSPATYHDLFPSIRWADEDNKYNPKRISSVQMPDNRQYQFFYNVYGELARVVLPTGGAIEYDYTAALRGGATGGSIFSGQQIYRRVVERRLYADGGLVWENRQTYSRPEDVSGNNDGFVEVAQYGYPNTLMAREKHYYFGSTLDSFSWSTTNAANYSKWQDGKEWKTEAFDTDGSLKQRITHNWVQRAPVSWWSGDQNFSPANDPRIADTTTKLVDTNQLSQMVFTYDRFNNKTEVDEYDFGAAGAGAVGTLKRRTHTDYLETNIGKNYATVNPNITAPDVKQTIHLRRLPREQFIYDGSDLINPVAKTTYEYDNYSAGLTDRSNIISHARSQQPPDYTTSFLTRGNVTQITSWLLPSTALSTRLQYDIAGNVVSSTDPLQRTTTFDFSDKFGPPDGLARNNVQSPSELGTKATYAFASLVTNALSQTAYSQRDYYTGNAVDSEDSNGSVTSGYYSDLLDRPTQIIQGAQPGSPLTKQSIFIYNDAARVITTKSDQTTLGDNLLKSETVYDGLGRTTETRQYETASSYILARQGYDAMGRVSQTSNPYRPATESLLWTTTAYDGLGRVKQVTTPDGATMRSDYSGLQILVTDQAGKQRRSSTDGLGRLIQVSEDPAGLNYLTTYSYDALDNLVNVNQGGQIRSFIYDSLKRLKQATNPESEAINYDYDSNSNLWHRTDARGVITTYSYDWLNRVTRKTYSDSTPQVNYYYDSQSLPAGAPSFNRGPSVGRLVAALYSGATSSTGNYQGYDQFGRVVTSFQKTDSQSYQMSYGYNLAGELTSETYPSGRVVTTSYDTTGRIISLSGQKAGEGNKQYANQISYWSHGAIKQMQMGNLKWEHTSFNTRLQPTEIGVGINASDASLLKLEYGYGSMTNNGNVLTQTVTAPKTAGGSLILTQSYGYDGLNRLQTASESGGASLQQTYDIDRWGNRAVRNTSYMPTPQLTPQSATATDFSAFNQSTNRLSQTKYPSVMYDGAGNLTRDIVSSTFTYDGENRQIGSNVQGVSASYSYDGDGRRVKKVTGSVTVMYIYNVLGQIIAEYTSDPAPPSAGGGGTSYLTSDMLGSVRVVTNGSGLVKARYDYLPFGEEMGSSIGSRSLVDGYGGADSTKQKFTSKERDGESGLDYFLARYYSSAQGRFLSADPYNVILAKQMSKNIRAAESSFVGYLGVAQQWNRYSYATNNPLKYIDPNGEKIEVFGNEEDRKKAFQRIKEIVGADAAKMLNVREENGHYYVDYDHSKAGGLAKFSELAASFEKMMDSDNTVDFHIATTFQFKYSEWWGLSKGVRTKNVRSYGGAATLSPEESVSGNIEIYVHPDAGAVTQESFGNTFLSATRSNDGKPLDFYNDIVDAHEFGHAYGMLKGYRGDDTNDDAHRMENYVRERRKLPNRRVKE